MHPADAYLAGLAPATRRVAQSDLRALSRMAFPGASEPDWRALDPGTAAGLGPALAARYAPGTANRMLANLRGVVRACYRAGAVSFDRQIRLLAAVPRVKGRRVTRGRALTYPEVVRLLEAAAGDEERALLAVTTGCGLRRAEALALTWDRVKPSGDGTWNVRVLGKGNREHRLRLPTWAAPALSRWFPLCPRREHVFRWTDGAAVARALARASRASNLGHVAPHDLRRTFFALCVRSDLKLPTIQRLMRHASIRTTMLYDRRPDEEIEAESAALDKLDRVE